MYTLDQRDQLYEIVRYLNFNDLRYLCQSNKSYNELCKEARFQKLIQQRYDEMISYQVNNIIDKLAQTNKTITFNLINDPKRNHKITITRAYNRTIYLSEELKNIDYPASIIYKYAINLLKFNGFENITQEEYEHFINDPRLIKSPYSNFQLITDIDFLLQKINIILFDTNKTSFYNIDNRSINPLMFNVNAVQHQSLIDILTLIYKLYPNVKETYYD